MSERDVLLEKYPNLNWDELERLKILLREEAAVFRANGDPRLLGWGLQISIIQMRQYEMAAADESGWLEVAKLNK